MARLAAIAAGDAAGARGLANDNTARIVVSERMRPVHRILDGWDAVEQMPAAERPPADDCSL